MTDIAAVMCAVPADSIQIFDNRPPKNDGEELVIDVKHVADKVTIIAKIIIFSAVSNVFTVPFSFLNNRLRF